MKFIKAYCLFLLSFHMSCICMGQIEHLGFTQQVKNPENSFVRGYFPKLKVVNDTLFVCSNTGIFQKDLKQNSDWSLYAFDKIPIIEFIKNGNELLAVSTGVNNGQDSLLLFSSDNGKTFMNYTPAHFLKYGNNYLHRIAQNPKEPCISIILDVSSGVSKSYDFGKNWFFLNTEESIGQFINYIGFHPLDTATIFYSGETDYMAGKIFKSSDNGNSWSSYSVPGGDNCVHHIDFHPSDPNILIWSGEGKIGKSTDKGETWKITDLYDTGMYFYKVFFDKDNPEILYASGTPGRYHEDAQNTIWVYRSTDTGETWHVAYKEPLGANGGEVIDMIKYKDKLIFYTKKTGIWELDVKTTPILSSLKSMEEKNDLYVYTDPVIETLHFQTGKSISQVDIIDFTGRIVQKSCLYDNENSIDVSNLSTGIYNAIFHTSGQSIFKKVCIRH